MDEHVQRSSVDVTLGQLGTSDHCGWLTDMSCGEQRRCVLVDLVFCVFASEKENERPTKTLLMPGLHVKRLLFMSAHAESVSVDTTARHHHSPNGTTVSGMPRHQFVISDPVSGRTDIFGSRLLSDVTEWIRKLELAIAQQADMTSQTNVGAGFRNDRCVLQKDMSEYFPSAFTRDNCENGYDKEVRDCRCSNAGGDDGRPRKWHHRLVRHTESSPPKCDSRRLYRTSSCPTNQLWCEHPQGGNHATDEKTHSNLRNSHSLFTLTKGTRLEGSDCPLGDVTEADRRSPKRKSGLRRALSLGGIISTKTHRNNTLTRMKQFFLGFKMRRRRTMSHTTLVESSVENHNEAWPLDELSDDPKMTLLRSTPAVCNTPDLGSDVGIGSCRLKSAFSETALNCDGKRRPRQRHVCRRAATVTSRTYEHRTEPKTVSFVTHDVAGAHVEDAPRMTGDEIQHGFLDTKQDGVQDTVSPSQAPRRVGKRRRVGLFRKVFFNSFIGFLRCASTRHKDLGVTNCIRSRATPWATGNKTVIDDSDTDSAAASQKVDQRKVRTLSVDTILTL